LFDRAAVREDTLQKPSVRHEGDVARGQRPFRAEGEVGPKGQELIQPFLD
jgi:hypothetical protein